MISVVIPVYNGAATIRRAVQTVLDQHTAEPFETIVVDDGSIDTTAAALADFASQIRYIRQPNRGRSTACNVGVEAARGNIVAFVDADDRWHPGKLEAVERAFVDAPNVGLAFSNYVAEVEVSGVITARTVEFGCVPSLEAMFRVFGSIGPRSTVAIRREAYRELGGFDPRLNWGEDIDLWLRLRQICDFAHIPAILSTIHQRGDSGVILGSYSGADYAAFENALTERFGARARPLIRHMHEQWAAIMLNLGLAELERDKLAAFRTLMKLTLYRPSYVLKLAHRIFRPRNLRRLLPR